MKSGNEGEVPSEVSSIFKVFKKRRSVRAFKSTPIPDSHIKKMIDAARLAPNAGNQQPCRFLVVRDREILDELEERSFSERLKALKQRGENMTSERIQSLRDHYHDLLSAPVQILVLVDKTVKYNQYTDKDGALAAAHIILSARALGYGSVFVTDSISEANCRAILKIPDKYSRTCIIPVGYPRKWPQSPKKRGVAEVMTYDRI